MYTSASEKDASRVCCDVSVSFCLLTCYVYERSVTLFSDTGLKHGRGVRSVHWVGHGDGLRWWVTVWGGPWCSLILLESLCTLCFYAFKQEVIEVAHNLNLFKWGQ